MNKKITTNMLQINKDKLFILRKLKRQELDNLVLCIGQDAVTVCQKDEIGNFIIDAVLKPKVFSIYNVSNEIMIAIPDYWIFQTILESFDKSVDIEIDPTKVILKGGNKVVEYCLLNPEIVAGRNAKLKYKYTDIVEVPLVFLSEVLKISDTLKADKICIEQKGYNTVIRAESYMHKATLEYQGKQKFDAVALVPSVFFEDTIRSLSNKEIKICFTEEGNSVQIREESDDFSVVTTLAGLKAI